MFTIEEYLNSLKSDKSKLVTNLNEKGVEASNDETFTTLVPKVSEIISGADLSEYFTGTIGSGGVYTGGPGVRNMIKTIPEDTTISGTSAAYMFYWCSNLTSIPLLDTSNVINMSYMFHQCSNLTSIPLLDTSNVTDMSYMLNTCSRLTTVPLLNTSKVTNFNRMFSGTSNLTDASVDNILQMCINATSYTGNKTLAELGFIQNVYTASRLEALPHYQDFIDAGWTIGY